MLLEEFKQAHKGEKAYRRMDNNPNKEAVNEATANGMRWVYIEPTKGGQRRFGGEARRYWNLGINGSGTVSTYSMRPGWHAGSLPTMRQIGKDPGRNLRDDRFVWVEGEISADVDYNEEAQGNPDNDIPTHIPVDGFYLKATNANAKASQADRVGWYISGAFKPNKIMSDWEARAVIDAWNADPKHKDLQVEYDFPRESGKEFNAETMQLEEPSQSAGTRDRARFSMTTEEREAQIHSENFKKWFGDWEKSIRLSKLRKSVPVRINGSEYKGKYDLNRKSARKWILDNLRGEYTNRDTGDTIFLSRPGAEEVTSHSLNDEAHMKSLVAIPKLIEDSIFIEEGEGDSKEIGTTKYDSYRYYVCGLNIGGVDYTVKVVIGVKDGKRYYDHALTEIEKGKLLDLINGQAVDSERNFTTKGDAPSPSSEPFVGKDKRLISLLQDNSSKVVDAEGRPLVVYHGGHFGQPIEDYDTYTWNADGAGGWFSPSREYSNNYRGVLPTEDGRGYDYLDPIQVYLNIRNPFELGDNNGYIVEDGKPTQLLTDVARRLGVDEKAITDMIDWDFADSDKDAPLYTINRTKAFADLLKSKGYDGAHAIEFGNDTYMITDPTQIKSATENNGEFSRENPDIRYSLSEEDQRLFDGAKRKFGVTSDIREAGYVLPDGSMLDFSGRHELDPGTDSSFLAGRRATDHRAINQISFIYDENGDEVLAQDLVDQYERDTTPTSCG